MHRWPLKYEYYVGSVDGGLTVKLNESTKIEGIHIDLSNYQAYITLDLKIEDIVTKTMSITEFTVDECIWMHYDDEYHTRKSFILCKNAEIAMMIRLKYGF